MAATNQRPRLAGDASALPERPTWFLDVDGTIAPIFGSTPPSNAAAWSTLYPGIPSDLTVRYRRGLISEIAAMHRSGLVDVRWLSTWDDEALSDWARLGLGPFPATPRAEAAGRRAWWKGNVVATWMRLHPSGRVIWTDDDITRQRLRGLDGSRLLTIAPDPTVGLTERHLAVIRQWIETPPAEPARRSPTGKA